VWADGKPIRLSDHTHRLYLGDESQEADPAIEAAGLPLARGGRRTTSAVTTGMRLPKAARARSSNTR
jgi:hypothetical protein